MAEEQFQFTASAKKKLFIVAIVGFVLLILGIFIANSTGQANEVTHGAQTEQLVDNHGGEHSGDGYHWSKRVFANLWINNMYFVGIAILGVFFIAIQYVSQAG